MAESALKLVEIRNEAADTKSFIFEREGFEDYLPGQYITMKMDVPGDLRRGIRSFTISSAPSEGVVMITTRIRSVSLFKKKLASMRTGDVIAANGPSGKFTLHGGQEAALFLAGGIGVTPFRSMIREAISSGRHVQTVLIASDRTPELIPFRDEFERWAADNDWLKVVRTVTRPDQGSEAWKGRHGRIDKELLTQLVGAESRTIVYIAGPTVFVQSMRKLLEVIGVSPEHIRTEVFTGY